MLSVRHFQDHIGFGKCSTRLELCHARNNDLLDFLQVKDSWVDISRDDTKQETALSSTRYGMPKAADVFISLSSDVVISTCRQINWESLNSWDESISETERESLGVVNTSKDRMSSYNFDHVTTALGPGASVQRFFEDAKRSLVHVFNFSYTNNA